jgi:hypothetical protein
MRPGEASRRASKPSLEVDARPDIGDDPVTGIFTAQEINLPGKITFLLDETRA